jgi:hypothetical protein
VNDRKSRKSGDAEDPVVNQDGLPLSPEAVLEKPADLQLGMESLIRGIDNYRVDVQLSPQFVYQLASALDGLLKNALANKPLPQLRDKFYDNLKSAYLEMMRLLIHRTKTDLSSEQVQFLQFAIIKQVLQESRSRLDANIELLKDSASQQKSSGSARLLDTHDRIVWLRKQYGSIYYSVNQHILKCLQRIEMELRQDREHFLEGALPEAVDIMFNPMLQAENPEDDEFLLDQFALWGKAEEQFSDLNSGWEQILQKYSEFIPEAPIKSRSRITSNETAVYDELGGLFSSQPLLGTAENQRKTLKESLSWMELPDNIRRLFDETLDAQLKNEIKKDYGLSAWWEYRGKRKNLNLLLTRFKKFLRSKKRLQNIIASYELREVWSRQYAMVFEARQLCELVAGTASRTTRKLVSELPEEQKYMAKQIRELAATVNHKKKENEDGIVLRTLTDLSRFRQQLKYYRFAHRAFNRISVLTTEEDIELSRHGDQLYRLFSESEIEQDEPKIVHHAIIKADVRGSTTVTTELVNQKLNPASYFSQRFFDPINVLLDTYGAGKVFIEGDAVILSLMEYKETPQEWFAVSRACGLAREMVHVVQANNAYSQRVGLPQLEIGIGICFSQDAPLFLFDDDKPIMISPAIGDADRMSSCSWKMREKYHSGFFNVEVCDIAEGEHEKGEKGQQKIRYNVNGILLDDEAVKKIKSEIKLRKLNMKIGERDAELFVGRFPDVLGRNRTLVIRQSPLGLWKDNQVVDNPETHEHFFEVVTNRKVLGLVNDKLHTKNAVGNLI